MNILRSNIPSREHFYNHYSPSVLSVSKNYGSSGLRVCSSRDQDDHVPLMFGKIKKKIKVRQILEKEKKIAHWSENPFALVWGLREHRRITQTLFLTRTRHLTIRSRKKQNIYEMPREREREKEKERKSFEGDRLRETRIPRLLVPGCRFAEGASRSRVRFQHVTRPCNTSAEWRSLSERKEKKKRRGIRRETRWRASRNRGETGFYLRASARSTTPWSMHRALSFDDFLSQARQSNDFTWGFHCLGERERKRRTETEREREPLPRGHLRSHGKFRSEFVILFLFFPLITDTRSINCSVRYRRWTYTCQNK